MTPSSQAPQVDYVLRRQGDGQWRSIVTVNGKEVSFRTGPDPSDLVEAAADTMKTALDIEMAGR